MWSAYALYVCLADIARSPAGVSSLCRPSPGRYPDHYCGIAPPLPARAPSADGWTSQSSSYPKDCREIVASIDKEQLQIHHK